MHMPHMNKMVGGTPVPVYAETPAAKSQGARQAGAARKPKRKDLTQHEIDLLWARLKRNSRS
jgi:hypothetical protein